LRHLRLDLLPAVLAVFIAACGGAAETPAQATSPSADTGGIGIANTDLGTILVDGEGMTLYGFMEDTDRTSTCYEGCARRWPPVPGSASPAAGLDADVFTTTQRDDGTSQLVAGTAPLYTFVDDVAPGDVNGHGSGDAWFVVAPDGTLIDAPSEASSTAPSEQAVIGDGVGEPVLTDSRGFTLYYFRKDEPGRSNCNSPCSETWPPVPADEQINTSALDPGRVGNVTRDDGAEQLTYDGLPLYTFVDDVAPGDVHGQGVGNVWFAVAPDGSEIAPHGGVRIGSTDAGDVLIDPEGFALYTLDEDAEGESTCNHPCSETWPPVPGDVPIDGSVRDDQFDTITRDDGAEQLALNGQPLYRFIDDRNPGDVNGHGSGDVWFTVPADEVKTADGGSGRVTVGHTDLGPTLVSGDGRTLYAFTNDAFVNAAEGQSNCNDLCAEAWPHVPGDVTVDESAVTAETRTITRRDGSSQLAIGDWPVYTSSRDSEAGDINGHGSSGAWFAVAPDGTLHENAP
jgi:predicted lipoprotein with Yx(FWY)xxD motif